VPTVLKTRSLNLLKPSGSVQASTGIAKKNYSNIESTTILMIMFIRVVL
jgi:hypothetical protein